MSLSKRVLGLLALCALVLGVCAAQAGAASNGTTAFTCKETGSGGFTKAHCKAADAGGGEFSHVEIQQDATTEINWTNEKTSTDTTTNTVALIRTVNTILGGSFVFEATGVSGTGSLTNKISEGEHYVEGTTTLAFTGITVVNPAGKGCKVAGGKIETVPLKFTTEGQGMKVNFSPIEGTKFFEYTTEGCSVPALNTKFTVAGSLNGPFDGATMQLSESEMTAEESLKVGAGSMLVAIDSSIQLGGRSIEGGPFTPLSFTTVET